MLSDSDEASPIDKRGDSDSEARGRYAFDAATNDLDLPEVPFCREKNYDSSADEDLELPRVAFDFCDPEKKRMEEAPSQRPTTSRTGRTSKEERAKRQRAMAREKVLRAIASKKSKNMKPGECIKFMEVDLDRSIEAFAFAAKIKDKLLGANVQFNVTDQLIPNSITWRRNVEEEYVDEDDDEVRVRKEVQIEKQVIVIWSNDEAAKHAAEGTFCESVINVKSLLSSYTMTLVIFGMEEYFARRRKVKRASDPSSRDGDLSRPKSSDKSNPETFPIVSRQQLEMCLVEVQIVASCSSRLIEDAEDLALMVYQYTKSISEIPYKLQKKENIESKFEWYVMGDNKNTVRVDKDGNGLKRLWQQQLCQFNLSSLEIAEAICAVYPSPARLIEVLFNHSNIYWSVLLLEKEN